MKNYEQTLNDEILRELETLSNEEELGTDGYKITVDGITKLIDKAIELKKVENEVEEKVKNRELDNDLKLKQLEKDNELKLAQIEKENALKLAQIEKDNELKMKQIEKEEKFKQEQLEEDKKDRLWKNGIAIAGIIIPSLITIWGTIKSLKFEEEGTVTTIMGRGFINKLLPKK